MRELTQSGIAAMEKRISEVVKDVDCWFLTCRQQLGMTSLEQAFHSCEDEDRNGFEISALYTKSGHPECITPEDNWFKPQVVAKWVENSSGIGQYEIVGQSWISHDGIEWINERTGEPVDTEEFHATQISMVGGCCDGEVVG